MRGSSLGRSGTVFFRSAVLAGLLTAAGAGGRELEAQGGRAPAEHRARREALERRVRERIAAEVQDRLQLTDVQTQRLGETNRKFEERRRLLLAEERTTRMGLREQLMRGDSADQKRVGTLVDQLISVQRRRIDLVEQEQRELAGFLTAVQRATYLSMQDQMRRRMEEMRGGQRRGGRGRPGSGSP